MKLDAAIAVALLAFSHAASSLLIPQAEHHSLSTLTDRDIAVAIDARDETLGFSDAEELYKRKGGGGGGSRGGGSSSSGSSSSGSSSSGSSSSGSGKGGSSSSSSSG